MTRDHLPELNASTRLKLTILQQENNHIDIFNRIEFQALPFSFHQLDSLISCMCFTFELHLVIDQQSEELNSVVTYESQ